MKKATRNIFDKSLKNQIHRKKDLSIEEVRAMDRFKDHSDEQIQTLITQLKGFSDIVFGIFTRSQV